MKKILIMLFAIRMVAATATAAQDSVHAAQKEMLAELKEQRRWVTRYVWSEDFRDAFRVQKRLGSSWKSERHREIFRAFRFWVDPITPVCYRLATDSQINPTYAFDYVGNAMYFNPQLNPKDFDGITAYVQYISEDDLFTDAEHALYGKIQISNAIDSITACETVPPAYFRAMVFQMRYALDKLGIRKPGERFVPLDYHPLWDARASLGPSCSLLLSRTDKETFIELMNLFCP